MVEKGFSFAFTNAAGFEDIKPWTDWSCGNNENNERFSKTPSRIAYASENPDLNHSMVWGYEVEPGMVSCSWTKMLLDQSAPLTEYDDPNLMKATANGLMRLPRGKTAQQVVTDYMRGLFKAFTRAAEIHGMITVDGPVMPMEFWVTVPATWSDEAKIATRTAALAAGFGAGTEDEVNLITEPEAAAHLALKDSIHHVDDKLVKVGLPAECTGSERMKVNPS